MIEQQKSEEANIPDDAIFYPGCSCGKLPKPSCVGSFNTITSEMTLIVPITGQP